MRFDRPTFVAICASIAIVGCSGLPAVVSGLAPIAGTVAAQGDSVLVRGTQGLIIAEYAYQGAGQALLSGVRAGAIKGDKALKLRDLANQVNGALATGSKATTAADQALAAAKALDAIAKMNLLLKEK